MSETTRLIKRYYHSIKSVNLRSLVDQVDIISELLANMFDADFLAVYYKKQGNEQLIPVGYNNRGHIISPDIQKIEQEYCLNEQQSQHLVPGLISFEMKDDSENNLFAKENKLNYLYQYPHLENKKISILILAYWHNEPKYDEKKLIREVSSVINLLQMILTSIDDQKIANDYTIRLSDMISLFEIDISEYRYNELTEKLIWKLNEIIPSGYFTFMTDNDNKCKYAQAINIEKPSDSFIAKFETELGLFSKELDDVSLQNGVWVDYHGIIKSSFKTILVSPICVDTKRKTFLVYVSDQINNLSDNDKQLLSLFSLFSSIILQASNLIESEKRVNKLLKKTSSQMADIESLAAITDLTSGVAHEFNNMIGGIVGRVQLLKIKIKDVEILDKLDKIEQIAQDGANTVQRIQEFSSGSKHKKTKQFDLVTLLQEFNNYDECNWYKLSLEKNVKVESNVKVHNACITGIYQDVLLALHNLVENAVEYADENSTVQISLSENKNYYEFKIHNMGPVIDKSELKRIFYPFFTKKDTYGAGMGLSIVHGIVTRHGGKISVTSDKKSGTTFTMEFLKPDTLTDDSDISRKIKTVQQLKILVVDDDDQIREVLTDMLSIDNYDTVACADGFSALDACKTNTFDLVITDLGMPGMSGLELSDEIHKLYPNLPIAMITGWGTQLNHDEVALKGIKTVLSKPFHLKDIKAMISELINDGVQA